MSDYNIKQLNCSKWVLHINGLHIIVSIFTRRNKYVNLSAIHPVLKRNFIVYNVL